MSVLFGCKKKSALSGAMKVQGWEIALWLPYGTLLSSVMYFFFFLVYNYGINSVSSVIVCVSEILSENDQDIFPVSWLLQAKQQIIREFRWLDFIVKSASDCRASVEGVGWGRGGGGGGECKFESKLHLTYMEIIHEIISVAILPILLIQEGQLSVTDESRCTSTG